MFMAAFRSPKTRTYLVLLTDHLVAQDLLESIAVFDPTAEVIVERSCAAALTALEGVQAVAVAFIGVEPLQFCDSALAEMIRVRGGQVILMGDEAEECRETLRYKVLHRPFSESVVLEHLAALGVL